MSSKKKSKSPSNGLKQGTLFSFFSKKPSPAAAKKAPCQSPPSSSATVSSKSGKGSTIPTKYTNASPAPIKQSNLSSQTIHQKNTKLSAQDKLLAQIQVGSTISVYWPDDDEYYNAKISSKKLRDNNSNHLYTLVYDDGEVETIDLSAEKFKIVHPQQSTTSSTTATATAIVRSANVGNRDGTITVSQDEHSGNYHDDYDDEDEAVGNIKVPKKQNGKKRKVIQESDEEAEFDDEILEDDENDDDESNISEFIVDTEDEANNNDEDEEISMVMTDEEDNNQNDMDLDDIKDEDDKPKKKKAKTIGSNKRLRVTQICQNNNVNGRSSSTFITPPPKKKKATSSASTEPSKLNSFAAFASGSQQKSSNADSQKKPVREITPVQELNFKSPLSSSSSTSPHSSSTSNIKIPRPIAGVVNQAGTHYHNHFTFLQPHKRRDGKNRPMSHPDYDPRTLMVDYNEMERVTGSKLTQASQQWWEIKSKYADTFLLFKTGKFYEIYHEDADVSVQVLGFNYMKGQVAHTGFPEIGYGGFCEKLIQAGYKVARVEQTETPDMLKERKKNTKVGKKPSVVNREVCSIVSAGTRTFCYMDDIKCLEKESSGVGGSSGIGPLLVIKEITFPASPDKSDDCDEVQPVCEYGITLVDAATGEITLGQFADDVLRSRMNTLITKFCPCEIIVQGGSDGASETLMSLIKGAKNTFLSRCQVEKINTVETFPKSYAIDSAIRSKMERPTTEIKPWNNDETLQELHRRGYYPRSSRKSNDDETCSGTSISRWPEILKVCIKGGAELAISSFGAALFYLQRNLIDEEILSMGIIKGYIPPEPAAPIAEDSNKTSSNGTLRHLISQEERKEDGIDDLNLSDNNNNPNALSSPVKFAAVQYDTSNESAIDHLSLDGTTIANLEILANSHSNTPAGSLWSKINFTKSPIGNRLLRAWLLRPLFRKEDIDRRADAVEELTNGGTAAAMAEARGVLSKCGDMERLLSRVHSMGYIAHTDGCGYHPNERAVLYETPYHTKRKVEDFSKLMDSLQAVARIPEIFEGCDIRSPLLGRIVRTQDKGGLFPSNLEEELDWFTNNFSCSQAAKGNYEPSRGVDEDFDAACDEIVRIKKALDDYRVEMCETLVPKHIAKSKWNYANTKVDSKDKYLIELPINVQVPSDFLVKGKRGKGPKQINKYRTPVVEQLVNELEHANDVMKAGKARGIQMIFSKFDSMRPLWTAACHASAMLDALGALAQASTAAGYCRPIIKDCSPDQSPSIHVIQGRHPCVNFTHSGDDFIPNDLCLGGDDMENDKSRVLLLSGPNMGGKSTLLRQTCLIAILAQVGCFVPAEECTLTPFDRIFTRLGASDRILLGQSTFFVELAETAAALRGATRRSLCIFDELGRGTSTFDGTAIASATIKHLIERNQCITLFATHYHSLLEDWKNEPFVRLGHMECFVEEDMDDIDAEEAREGRTSEKKGDNNITFLYTLGDGACPRSFGINVAKLAGLPLDVIAKAKVVSISFEHTLASKPSNHLQLTKSKIIHLKERLTDAIERKNEVEIKKVWKELQ